MSVFPPAREGWADGNGRRILGLDSRVLQLNVHLQESEMPPPNRAVEDIRKTTRSLKIAGKSLLQRVKGRRDVDTEASAGGEKTSKKALIEYRQTLGDTFGNSKSVNGVIKSVKLWINGL